MTNLLYEAYTKIDKGNIQSALDILEFMVQVDPLNIEAWEAYMQVCETCEELDSLCERILQVPGIIEVNRESIIDYYCFLRQKFRSCNLRFELHKNMTFELVDQFTFSSLDQSLAADKSSVFGNFQKNFIRLMGKAMIVPYVILSLTGLSLLFAGNSFGSWILVVITLGIIISLQKTNLPITESNRRQSAYQAIFSSERSDEVGCHSELTN